MEEEISIEEKYEILKERYKNLYHDFKRYKERTESEQEENISNASEKVITDILPVLDDLKRATKSVNHTSKDGINLILNKFNSILEKNGLKEINTSNHPEFNTDLHEAITIYPDKNNKNKVIDTILNGYILNDKVIRHAKVIVGK